MIVAVLGWATVAATALLFVVVMAVLGAAARRPWLFRTRVRVPKEIRGVQWEEDSPFPWI